MLGSAKRVKLPVERRGSALITRPLHLLFERVHEIEVRNSKISFI